MGSRGSSRMNSPTPSRKGPSALGEVYSAPGWRSPPPSARHQRTEVGSSVYGPIRGMRLSSRRWNPTGSVGSIASESKVSKDSLSPMFRLRSSSEEIQDLNQKLNHTCSELHKTKQELVEAKTMLHRVQSGGQDMMHAMKRSLRKAKRGNETLHVRLCAKREMRKAEIEDMEDRLLTVVRENQVEEISNLKGVLKQKNLMIDKLQSSLSGVRRLQRGSAEMI